ncbi:hypothetical protein [Burkholderia gladioli]|uniref:hypothetical protein n=1 Tax=Burkholderia gladioli TaxID=28095 RepID=UPI00164185F5|nr:hypothetical protein [Burkholderia gladioli]
MSKYEKLDAALVAKIGHAPTKFAALFSGEVSAECDRLAREEGENRCAADAWRIADRRLQALRKAGKIESTTKGWVRAARDGDGS